jgi:hypothetical protein
VVLELWHGRIQAEHVDVIGVYSKFRKGNTGGSHEAERACFSSPGALKIYVGITWDIVFLYLIKKNLSCV